MSIKVMENFKKTMKFQEPDEVPVAIWSLAMWYLKKLNIRAIDYYQGMELKLNAQVKLQEQYPEVLMFPGIWPDFGVAAEPSAFGCPIHWTTNEAPVPLPAISSMNEVLHMKPIDVKSAGLLPDVIKTYEYYLKHLDRKYIEEYEQTQGMVFFMGPLETAALIRGYQPFLLELYDNPVLVHKLLDIVTTTQLDWLKYLETKIGKIRRLYLADHFPTQISADQFEEFFFPYIKRIYDEYPDAIKLYHNEGKMDHVISRVPDMGANIFMFGSDVSNAKKKIGDRVCLMGNLEPVSLMQNGEPGIITQEALRVLKDGAPGGGYILSAAGSFGVDISDKNLEAMINAPKVYKEMNNDNN